MFKNQKGITLIALVITIIVLLILAGVTIAMLTGSDSAPQKANEAKQKQDIGAAKDQVYVMASKYQMDAYDRVYVQGKGAATNNSTLATGSAGKSGDIGSVVGSNIVTYFSSTSNKTVGNATVYVKSSTDTTKSAEILIQTTDFEVKGHIQKAGGTLIWDDTTIIDKTTSTSGYANV